jgi:hypothetical protein
MTAPDSGRTAPPLYRRALVVFTDDTGLFWLGFLKRGFRHCFVALDDGRHWLLVEPLAHRLEIRAAALPGDFDLAGYFRGEGLTVVETRPRPALRRRAPLAPFTCVEAAKRLLGIRRRRIVTPWQLYRHLAASGAGTG